MSREIQLRPASGHERREARGDNGEETFREDQDRPHAEDADREEAGPKRGSRTRVLETGTPNGATAGAAPPSSKPVDCWRLLDAVTRRWFWLLAGALLLGGAGMAAAFYLSDFSVRVPLIRRQTYNAYSSGQTEGLQIRDFSSETLLSMMRSPELLERVGAKAPIPVTLEELAGSVKAYPDRIPDRIWVQVNGKLDKETLAAMANLYADEVVAYTKELQAGASADLNEYLKLKLADITNALVNANRELARFAQEANVLDFEREIESYLNQLRTVDLQFETARIDLETVDRQIARLQAELNKQGTGTTQLQKLEAELNELLLSYTESHPLVRNKRNQIEALKQMQEQGGAPRFVSGLGAASLANPVYLQILDLQGRREALTIKTNEFGELKQRVEERAKQLSSKAAEYALFKGQRQRLETVRGLLEDRQREAQLLQENALGYFKVQGYATPADVSSKKRMAIIGFLTFVGSLTGLLGVACLVLLTEVMDSRLKTAADVQRVTRLPVMATLGDLRWMSPSEQVNWAFRTLTLLQGRLTDSLDQSLVCGFISSHHGEGRSTWINLLVSAASQRGLKVLTVATRSASENGAGDGEEWRNENSLLPVGPATMLNKNVLAYPDQVLEQLNNAQSQPVIHIPLPGWVWNLERRKQWQAAVEEWRKIHDMVLLIELPPACEPESVLLAENLPQVLWLTGSGMANIEETTVQLETLRHARCNVVGAVLNREPASFWRKRLGGMIRRFGS